MPFKDFGGGSYAANLGDSTYHGLQTKLEDQFSNGLTFLLTYTWSKTMSDAGDLLNGGSSSTGSSSGPFRALGIPGLGPRFDWGPANFDVRNVVHFSGGYQLPFGKGMKYMNQGGIANAILGGWAVNWIRDGPGWAAARFRLSHRDRIRSRLSHVSGSRSEPAAGHQDQDYRWGAAAVLAEQSRSVQPAMQTWVGRASTLLPYPIPRPAASR